MPELPEVETIRRELLLKISGHTILSASLTLPRLLLFPKISQFYKQLENVVIEDIRRHGKYLLFILNNGHDLMIHLGMTGRLFVREPDHPIEKHTHLRLYLTKSKNECELRFVDARTFGKIALVSRDNYSPVLGLHHLGIDPLSSDYTFENFDKIFRYNRQMKALLMDQSQIAGLGNIYVDEVLHAAGIHPQKTSSKIRIPPREKLYNAIREILEKSITFRGSTILSFVNTDSQYSEFQNHLKVYGRENLPCTTCGKPIRRIIVVSRSTYYCPHCQKK